MLRLIGICLVSASLLMGLGCASKSVAENEAECKAVKPGVVTTVNHYCVIVQDDPVNPEVVREYKGQKVGFCCQGCIKKWDAMTDAQKDAAIKSAVAKGKP